MGFEKNHISDGVISQEQMIRCSKHDTSVYLKHDNMMDMWAEVCISKYDI